MPSVKCDNCGHLVGIEDSTKKYRLPLFFIFLGIAVLAYGNLVNNPNLVITDIGIALPTAGLVWLVVTRFLPNKADKKLNVMFFSESSFSNNFSLFFMNLL